MIGYLLRRLALAVSLVWAVSLAGFIAFALTFDPLWQLRICASQKCRAQLAHLTVAYHLDKPVLERYWIWLSGYVRHGFSFRGIGGFPINSQLLSAAKVTAELMSAALVVTVVFAVLVGVASARRPGRPLDLVLRVLAYVSWSLPTFLVASLALRWFGSTGWFIFGGGQIYVVGGQLTHRAGGFVTWIRTMTVPVLTLSLGLIGLYSRYVRTALLTELHRPYAVVARAKGLTETRVAYRHALRNALPPFVSVLSLEIGAILGASLAVDYVFQMGGLASYFLNALTQSSDPYELTAVVVAASAVVVVLMLVADFLVGWLDPRTALASR
jgi:peptide/nickel transport system permease protein